MTSFCCILTNSLVDTCLPPPPPHLAGWRVGKGTFVDDSLLGGYNRVVNMGVTHDVVGMVLDLYNSAAPCPYFWAPSCTGSRFGTPA